MMLQAMVRVRCFKDPEKVPAQEQRVIWQAYLNMRVEGLRVLPQKALGLPQYFPHLHLGRKVLFC